MTSSIEAPAEKRRGRPPKEVIESPSVDALPIGVKKEQVKQDDYNVEIVRDYYGMVDPFYLSKKDPNYAYRFLRDDPKNLSTKTGNLLFQKGGWQFVQRDHALKIGLKDREISPDGLVRRGDCILAFMPKSLFNEKQDYKVNKANEQMGAIRRLQKEGDATVGGRELHPTMKGIQTKEQLKGSWKE